MWRWFGLGMVPMVAVMPLGCSSEEDDMHTQILRSATPKAGTADTSATGVSLTGEWEAVIENYGPASRDGPCSNVYRITQTGSAFRAVRSKDDPLLTKEAAERGHSPWGPAGSVSLQGELETTGFKNVQIVFGSGGRLLPSQGQISEDGKKIVIDNGATMRVTLTKP